MRRIFHIVKKELIQLIRDPRMLTLAFAAPIIQLIIFGYVATTDVKHVALAIYNLDKQSEAREIISSVKNSGYFDIRYIDSIKEVKELLDSGKAKIILNFPKDFSKNLKATNSGNLQIIVDGTESNTSTIALGYLSQIINNRSKALAQKKLRYEIPSLDARLRVWYNPDLKSVNYMVPGIIVLVLMIQTIILTALAVVKEREGGTMEQLIVTPIKPFELLLGKIIPFTILSFFDVILVIVIGTAWFRIPLVGSPLLLLLCSSLFLLSTLGLGLFISTISETQQQAMITSFMILFPSMLLSGFIFPIENMPKVIQYLTYLLPPRYFIVIVRGIFLKGIGINYLINEIWPLALFGIIIFSMSVARFRKRLA